MKISTTTLSIIAMAASPFLFIEMSLLKDSGLGNTGISGVCDFIYMTGWACTIIALLRLNATGPVSRNKTILYIQLGTLTIAQVWNIWTILDPDNVSMLYRIIDYFWPISNITLLIAGIVIAVKGVLQGWKRYAVLIAGSWLPFSILIFILYGYGAGSIIVSGIYSTIAWFGLGYMIWRSRLSGSLSFE